jgi:hypothetical protein
VPGCAEPSNFFCLAAQKAGENSALGAVAGIGTRLDYPLTLPAQPRAPQLPNALLPGGVFRPGLRGTEPNENRHGNHQAI